MENFKWNPYDYSTSSSAQLKWAKELMVKFNLKGSENILDIGCGDGKITAEISRYIPKGIVVGIDSSKDMIDYASAKFQNSGFPNLKFYKMDARSFVLKEKFDLVFSNATLHWLSDHFSVLKCISGVMKQNGRLIISCGGRGNADDAIKVVNRIMNTGRWRKYFTDFKFAYYFYGTEEYPVWLEQAGLSQIRVELVPKDMVHEGKDGLMGWIRTTWLPYTRYVPEKLREEFIEEVADEYLKEYPLDENGKAHAAMVRLEVEAVKNN
jgi:trans-aconitate 2-methyltransferase